MAFPKIYDLFKLSITKILDSEKLIEENDIKNVSRILKKFAKVTIKNGEIKLFLDSIRLYFELLNKYSQQFEAITASQCCTVRMALGVFLFVIDSAKIHEDIIKKFVKIFDVIVGSGQQHANIKEFLRVYSYLLNKVPSEVVKKLAVKQKSFPILYDIMRATCDIESQALIMEVVLKFFRFSHVGMEKNFLQLVQVVDVISTEEKHVYQNIRMIIDTFNENFKNIFSMLCSSIELDKKRVLEFQDARSTDDIWLDFNLTQKKLSFFCDKNVVSSLGELRYYTSTAWEVLSFSVKDVLKLSFGYDTLTENLKIFILLKNACFGLFRVSNFDTIRKLEISVSRYSNRFYKLVKVILPQMFNQELSLTKLKIPDEQETDSSATADLNLTDKSSSSPVVEQFTMRQQKISTRENTSPIKLSSDSHSAESDDVVIISEDENDESITKTTPPKNVTLSEPAPQKMSTPKNTKLKNNKNKEATSDCVKVSTLQHSTTFNKSISPISFSGSLFARSPSRCSVSRKKISGLKKKAKLSAPDDRRSKTKVKISGTRDISRIKISSSLTSPVINALENLNRKKQKEQAVSILFSVTEEIVEEEYEENCLDASQNCSISKVENWLRRIDHETVLSGISEKEPDEIPILPERTDNESLLDALPPSASTYDLPISKIRPSGNTGLVRKNSLDQRKEEKKTSLSERNDNESLLNIVLPAGTQNSQKSSEMLPEERMELLMSSQKTNNGQVPKSGSSMICNKINASAKCTVEDLLNILCSQSDKKSEASEKVVNDKHVKRCQSDSSEVPLSELVRKWKQNAEFEKKYDTEKPFEIKEKAINKQLIEEADDDVTAELDLDKENLSKNEPTKENNNVSIQSDATDPPVKATRRKLYNPGDLSYLNLTMNPEYLQSKEESIVPPTTPNVIRILSRSVRPKTPVKKTQIKKKNMSNKTNKERPSRKNSRKDENQTNKEKKAVVEKTKNSTKNSKVQKTNEHKISTKFAKTFNDLKEKFRAQKRERRRQKRLNNPSAPWSSSSSSPEPFGVAVNSLQNKRKPETFLDEPPKNKRQKRKASILEENDLFDNQSENKKINIISNVLIQPGSSHSALEDCCCCKSLAKIAGVCFSEFRAHLRKCKSDVLGNDEWAAVLNIIKGCVDKP